MVWMWKGCGRRLRRRNGQRGGEEADGTKTETFLIGGGQRSKHNVRDGSQCPPSIFSGIGTPPPNYEYTWGSRRQVREIERERYT